jgi:vacuolar-type H+-ATPase subunit F/Vma7
VTRIYYIGDEATAAGYRLAGALTRVPEPAEATETFRRALADGPSMVLLSSALAERMDPEELAAAVLGEHPLVAIVPDIYGRYPAPDIAREVRLALGIEP